MTERIVCPHCSKDRKKSDQKDLQIYQDGYFCHHCGATGTIKGGKCVPSDGKKPPLDKKKADGNIDKALEFFEKRCISRETLNKFQITFDGKNIKFPYFWGGDLVNIKYRTLDKKFMQEKDRDKVFYNIDSMIGEKEVIITEGECFSGQAEILTELGWVKFEEYQGQKVMQVDKNMSGSFVYPLRRIEKHYDGTMLKVEKAGNYESFTTPNHKLVYFSKGRKGYSLKKREVCNMTKDIMGYIPTAIKFNGVGVGLSRDKIALVLAISADAAIRPTINCGTYVYFGLKKQRKVERLCNLLERLRIKHSVNIIKNGYTSICFTVPDYAQNRMLPLEWIASATLAQRKYILSELVYWDGNTVKNRKQTEYSTKYKENATWVQTMAHTCGVMSTVMHRKNDFGKWFKVSILHGKDSVSWQKTKPENVPFVGKVYCVSVDTGMLLVRQNKKISVSGNCDVLSLSEATYKSVISVPDGAPAPNVKNYKTKFEYIDNCIDIFKNMERIIIAVDNDAPGITLRQELVRRLGPVRCWTVTWPEGCKDANDVLVNKGAIALVDCIFKAKPVPVEGITELSDYWEDIKADYEKGGVAPGTSTGVEGMDEVYTVREGQVTIVTGIPSHGKSSFLTAMLVNMADRDNWRFAFFSPENMPTEHFIEKILTVYVGKPFNKGYHERMTFEEMKSAAKWYHSKFKHITPPIDKHYTVTDILKRAEVCVVRYGIRGVVIDPWNEINHERSGGLNETEHISRCLSDIRKFARQFGVHVWIVAHPTKIQKDKSGKTPPPTAYDISGSSNFYNKADNIFCVYRRDVFAEKKSVEVIIQKVRFRDVGQPGVVNLVFDPVTQRFNVDNFPAGSQASFKETFFQE